MKLLPVLAALPLLCTSTVFAADLMSVGYFNGGGDIDKLDVRQITHLNDAFGLIYNSEAGETNEALKDASSLHQIWLSPKVIADLHKIPELRKQNPSLKVLLSVDGWGRVDKRPEDKNNFTALLKELRGSLPKDKLITIAVGANAESPKNWVDVKAIAPYLNSINLMTYNMAYGTQYFNSNLYDSSQWPTVAKADKYSADFVVKNYLATRLKPEQMNLGIDFYGRVPKRATEPGIDWSKPDAQKNPATQPYFSAKETERFRSLGFDLSKDTYGKYNDIVGKLINDPQERFTEHWDDQAKVPWLSVKSAEGKERFALSYENPRSVDLKAHYIMEKGLGSAMFWEYGADNNNPLAKQLATSLGMKH